MTLHRPALLCLLAVFTSAPALAQTAAVAAPRTTNQAAPSQGEVQALQWFRMLDANGDGRISLDEAQVAFRLQPSLREYFKAADLNGDGYLTQQELRTVAERRRAERQARRQREAEAAGTPLAARNIAAPASNGAAVKKPPTAPISPR